MGIGRAEPVLLARAVDRPAAPIMAAALRLPHGIFPEIAVGERVALDDAPAGEAEKSGFQLLQHLHEIAAEHAQHRVLGHERKPIDVQRSRRRERKTELRAVVIRLGAHRKFVFMPLSVRARLRLDLERRLPARIYARKYGRAVVVGTHPEGELIAHTRFQIHAVVRLIGDARARSLRLHAQIVRVLHEQRAVVLDFERRAVRRGVRAPRVLSVRLHRETILFAPHFLGFKVAVFQHLRVQTAVQRIVDVLEKQPEASCAHGNAARFRHCDLHIFSPCRRIRRSAPRMISLYSETAAAPAAAPERVTKRGLL